MKLTQKQLLELATAVGLGGVEIVDNETDSAFDLDGALAAVDTHRRKIIEPQLRGELEEQIKTATEGRIIGSVRAILARNTGMSNGKLKEFGDDKLEDAVKAAIAHKIGHLEGDQQATAAKIEEMLKTHNEALAAKDTEWNEKYNGLNEKYISRDMLDFFQRSLKDAPLNEKLDKGIAAKDLMNHLREKYHLSYDEAQKTVALMDKANPAMPALNEAKNAQIDIMSEAKAFFEPRALWVTDTRDRNPAAAMAAAGGQRTPGGVQRPQPGGGRTSAAQQREQRLQSYDKANPTL